MPAPFLRTRVPNHCHHKASNRGVVRLDGHDHYTGRWGTPEADQEYRRLIGEWLARNPRPAADPADGRRPPRAITVDDLVLTFWKHVEQFYRRPDGTPTGEHENYRYALRPLRRMYGDLPAADLSPLKLRAVREQMMVAGLSRGVINGRVGRIVRMYRWAVTEELVAETVYRALAALPNLREGRSEAHEPDPIGPVSDERIAAVLPFLTPRVRTMVELQRVTGLRSSEVCSLRGADLDTSGEVWLYRPAQHKARHHGKIRVVFLGPKGQAVLRPWLREDPSAFLFSPRESMEEFRQRGREPLSAEASQSRINRDKAKSKHKPGDCYTYRSYGHAVRRACERAWPLPVHLQRGRIELSGAATRRETVAEWHTRLGPAGVAAVRAWWAKHLWHPHQIRHTRGTEIRKEYRLEGAQVALGHAHAKITETYAERDHDLARKIALETG